MVFFCLPIGGGTALCVNMTVIEFYGDWAGCDPLFELVPDRLQILSRDEDIREELQASFSSARPRSGI